MHDNYGLAEDQHRGQLCISKLQERRKHGLAVLILPNTNNF